jgi:hypothetical protein
MQDGKVIDDTSLDTQKHVILSWWQRNRKLYPDHEFASDEHGEPTFFEDPAQSASKIPLAQRPQGMHLMASCSPGDIIVVMDTDRVFRDTSDTLTTMAILKYRGVKLVSVNCPTKCWLALCWRRWHNARVLSWGDASPCTITLGKSGAWYPITSSPLDT